MAIVSIVVPAVIWRFSGGQQAFTLVGTMSGGNVLI
jgi:hypothetical protein